MSTVISGDVKRELKYQLEAMLKFGTLGAFASVVQPAISAGAGFVLGGVSAIALKVTLHALDACIDLRRLDPFVYVAISTATLAASVFVGLGVCALVGCPLTIATGAAITGTIFMYEAVTPLVLEKVFGTQV